MLTPSITRSSLSPAQVAKPLSLSREGVKDYKALERLGVYGLDSIIEGPLLESYAKAHAMDTIQQGLTTPSIPTVVQFLQNWLPGNIAIITAAQKIDEFIGINTSGNWDDEQIVQGVLENTGTAVPYADLTNVPYSSWNLNFVTRTVVRFEEGMRVGRLEEARAARVRIDSAGTKRASCALNLNIARNAIGFYGYNSGNNNTYGFLNDPNLPAYVQVSAGGSGSTLWSSKTILEICNDIRTAFAALQTQSADTINPETIATTLSVPTDDYQYLTTISDFGYSVKKWLNDNYPKCRVVSAPQLNNADSGSNVFYLWADVVADGISTDDMKTFLQVVPAKFQVLGVAPGAKGYEEDYSMATSGSFLKRGYAVVRYFGI